MSLLDQSWNGNSSSATWFSVKVMLSCQAPPMKMLSALVSVAASAKLLSMPTLVLVGSFGTEVVTVHRSPFLPLNVNMRAGNESSGSRNLSERRVPHEAEKKDITEPTLRKE